MNEILSSAVHRHTIMLPPGSRPSGCGTVAPSSAHTGGGAFSSIVGCDLRPLRPARAILGGRFPWFLAGNGPFMEKEVQVFSPSCVSITVLYVYKMGYFAIRA